MTTVLFWDIDGTLLTTKRAGIVAWERAVRECLGASGDLDSFPTSGRTDHEIAQALCRQFGTRRSASAADLVHQYEMHLPSSLPGRPGSVLPGVRDILDHVETRRDVFSMLLTGNTRAGATAKLTHYRLLRYFRHGGAYSETGLTRDDIARAALAEARRVHGVKVLRPFVIGDTPHDIRCARAIGALVVAVATGSHPLAQLETAEPWWALPRLPDPATFFSRLGLDWDS